MHLIEMIKQFLLTHPLHILGSLSALSAGAYLMQKVSDFAAKEVKIIDDKLLSGIKNPTLKQFAVEVQAAVDKAIPGAGDAAYGLLADMIVAEVGPQAVPAKPVIVAVLSAVGSGAKQGLSQ